MQTAMSRRLLLSIAVGMLAAWPIQPQQKSKEPVESIPAGPRTPEQIRADEANIRRICAKAEAAYRAVTREYDAAVRRLDRHPEDSTLRIEVNDLRAERLDALAKYCECLRTSYAKANLPMPDELKALCDQASAIAPPAPPDLAPPRAPGGEGAVDPCDPQFKKYNTLNSRLNAMPPDRPERAKLQKQVDAAFEELCECLRRTSPAKWQALCGPDAPGTGGSSSKPPGLAPPPAPPAGGIGSAPGAPAPEAVDNDPCADAAKEYKRASSASWDDLSNNWDSFEGTRRTSGRLVRAAKGYIWCAGQHGGTLPPELEQLKAEIAADPMWGGESVYGHPCSREWQTYQDLFIEHSLYPRTLGDGRSGAWSRVVGARRSLCECMRQRAPADYERLCVPQGFPSITPPRTPTNTRAAPPEAPPGTPTPTRTPTPNFVQLWTPQPGTTANVAMTVFSHGGNHRTGDLLFHNPEGCSEVSRATLLTFVTFGADAFSVAVGGLQPLPCARVGSGNSFQCQGTLPGFAGLANVGGSIDPLNVANGGVQGTFTVAVPGGGVVYQFTGRIQP